MVLKKSKYNTDKQGLDKKIEDIENKVLDLSRLVGNTTFNKKSWRN